MWRSKGRGTITSPSEEPSPRIKVPDWQRVSREELPDERSSGCIENTSARKPAQYIALSAWLLPKVAAEHVHLPPGYVKNHSLVRSGSIPSADRLHDWLEEILSVTLE